jgi:hypothetical protein
MPSIAALSATVPPVAEDLKRFRKPNKRGKTSSIKRPPAKA